MTLHNPGYDIPSDAIPCRTCGGDGWLYGGVCTRCNGHGIDCVRLDWGEVEESR